MLLLIEFEEFKLCVRSHYLSNINLLLSEYNLISKNSALGSGPVSDNSERLRMSLKTAKISIFAQRGKGVCIVVPKRLSSMAIQRASKGVL
jgi:hypothetical protein